MAVREMLLQLVRNGYEVHILGASVFDHECGTAGLRGAHGLAVLARHALQHAQQTPWRPQTTARVPAAPNEPAGATPASGAHWRLEFRPAAFRSSAKRPAVVERPVSAAEARRDSAHDPQPCAAAGAAQGASAVLL